MHSIIFIIQQTFDDYSVKDLYAVTTRKQAYKEIEGRPDLQFITLTVITER